MRLWAFGIAALIYDFLYFAAWLAIPVRAEKLGATATQLGLLQTASTLVFVANCLAVGKIADRWSKPRLVRASCVVTLGACIALSQAETLTWLFVLVPLTGFASSTFWPALQGSLGQETEPRDLERALGFFNMMWSAGKALGFFVAGWIAHALGPSWSLIVAGGMAVPILVFYPTGERRRTSTAQALTHDDRAVFRTMGYVANFVAFGVAAGFQNQFFKYLQETGLGTLVDRKAFFGLFLGLMFTAQTIAFFFLQKGARWTYRRGLLYGSQIVLAGAVLTVSFARHDLAILAVAPLIGVQLGFAYASSLYYSLHGPAEHGKYAGLHEAVLGAGSFVVPLLGGLAIDQTGELRMPYWLAAATALAALAAQEAIYRRSARSSEKASIR
ncbi:MAG TPA: MFS transporter [Planctomycetota bacterium]|nr:MFS transporter [Planctomycetota bacterium]